MSFQARSSHGLIGRTLACWTGISTSDARRLVLLKVTVGLAFLASLALTTNLWRSARSYPLVPVSSHLPVIPPPWDLVSLTALVGSIAALIAVGLALYLGLLQLSGIFRVNELVRTLRG